MKAHRKLSARKTSKTCKEMDATEYLMRSPANARRLLESIAEIEKDKNIAYKKLRNLIKD